MFLFCASELYPGYHGIGLYWYVSQIDKSWITVPKTYDKLHMVKLRFKHTYYHERVNIMTKSHVNNWIYLILIIFFNQEN